MKITGDSLRANLTNIESSPAQETAPPAPTETAVNAQQTWQSAGRLAKSIKAENSLVASSLALKLNAAFVAKMNAPSPATLGQQLQTLNEKKQSIIGQMKNAQAQILGAEEAHDPAAMQQGQAGACPIEITACRR